MKQLDFAWGFHYSRKLRFLASVLCDWNSQSAINLHYRLVSPCLVGANWNRLRQLLLTASLMAGNERRLCAVDPYVEQDHVAAQSDGENAAQYRESLRHHSPVNSILILLTKCCPEIESNHRVWTGSSSPNGPPLADWNKAQSIEKYNNIFLLYALHGNNGIVIIAVTPAHSSVLILNSRDQRCSKTDYSLTSALNSSHYFLLFKPPLTPRKGHRKQQVKFGEYAFSPFGCIEWIIQEQSLSETISSPFCRQATAGTLPAWHNWQWTQAILLIDYSDLLMENAKPHCIFHKAPVSNISSQRLPVADPLMFPDFPPRDPIHHLSGCFDSVHNYQDIRWLLNQMFYNDILSVTLLIRNKLKLHPTPMLVFIILLFLPSSSSFFFLF